MNTILRSLVLFVFLAGSLVHSQLTNGSFEAWSGGNPTGWSSGTTTIQGPGLVSGSNYSCILPAGTTMFQGFTGGPTNYQVSQVIAPIATTAWVPFAIDLQQVGAGGVFSARFDFIRLQLIQGSTGSFTLQAYSGAWQTIATNIIQASTYNSTTNTFTALHAYNFTVAYSSVYNNYSVTYGVVGGTQTTLSNLTYFAGTNAGQPLACVEFYGGGAAQSCAIDNVTLTAQEFQNGSFESWTGMQSTTPPTGTVTGWGNSGAVVRGPGLVSGSTYSSILNNNTTFYQGLTGAAAPTSYQISQVIALNSTTQWSPFGITLQQVGSGGNYGGRFDFIKLQMIQGSTGSFTLQARNGTTWQTIATNAMPASLYNASTNTFTTLNAYNFIVAYNGNSNTYAVSYGPVGQPLQTISNLSYYVASSVGQPFADVTYFGGGAAQSCAIDNVAISSLMNLSVPATTARSDTFMGFGAEWDSYGYPYEGINSGDLTTIQNRLAFMKPGFVRVGVCARWFYSTTGTFGAPTTDINALLANLTYCQNNNINVVITDWGCEFSWLAVPGVTWVDDDAYASLVGKYMNFLVNTKGYTCIKDFIFINEPMNMSGATRPVIPRWQTGVGKVYSQFQSYGLNTKVTFVGPDDSGSYTTMLPTALNMQSELGGYDLHYYPPPSSDQTNDVSNFFTAAWGNVRNSDHVTTKPVIVTEAGYADWSGVEGTASTGSTNPYNMDWQYGVDMARYGIQAANAGSTGISAWMLDDSSYPGFTWGMWQGKSVNTAMPLKPWFYSWALMCRSFPPGCTFAKIPSSIPNVQILAAAQPGTPVKWTFCIVNEGATPVSFTLQVPTGTNQPASRYSFSSTLGPLDPSNLPLPAESYTPPLTTGVPITVSADSANFLTPQ